MSRQGYVADRCTFLSRKKLISTARRSTLEPLEMRAAPGDFLGGLGVLALGGMWDDDRGESTDLVFQQRDDSESDDYWTDRALLSIAPARAGSQGGGSAGGSDLSETAETLAGKGGGFRQFVAS